MSEDERQAKRMCFDESMSESIHSSSRSHSQSSILSNLDENPESNDSLSRSESQLSTLSNYVNEKSEPQPEENDPPLHTAIIAEDINLIKKILSSGVDIDALDKEKNTALQLAVKNKYLPAIESLLEYGASISATNKTYHSYDGRVEAPLHIAVKENDLDIVKLLLSTRIDVNKLIPNYETVLNHAFECENFYLINHLIGNSYRPDSKDFIKKVSNIFLQPPIEIDDQLKAFLFQEYIRVNSGNHCGETPLILAVMNKNKSMIEYLIDNGADLNAKPCSKNALHIAVEENDDNIVKFLLNFDDCNVNAEMNGNLTPLHIAVSKNNLNIVKMLNEKNVKHDIYGTDKINYSDKMQPFHIAVYKNLIEMTEYFLDIIKVDVNIKTEKGESALGIAARLNNFDMFKLLLNHGAFVDYYHHNSKEGLYYGGTPLYHAIRNENVEMVDLLLNKGANVNVQLKDGTSVLHVAIKSGNEEIIKRLLNRDTDVNAKMNKSSSDRDLTPILQATENNLIEIIKILIKKGANINDIATVQSERMSIIDIAVKYGFRGGILLLTTVLNLGADINLSCIYEKKNCDKYLKQLIEKHILKLKAAKLFVNEKLNAWISRGPTEQKFFNECKKEVKKMQKEKINQTSSFCYFDLLNEKASAVAEFVETNSLVSEFYNSLAGFPLYAEMLTCHFERAQQSNKNILENKSL